MTSASLLELAHEITDNDPGKVGPLVKLLCFVKGSRGDPRSEALTTGLVRSLFSETDESERMGLLDYVREVQNDSLAA